MHAGPGFAAFHNLKIFPCGTHLRVTAQKGGSSVPIVVSDKGPNGVPGRIIDLNPADFSQLAPLSQGVVQVTIERE